MAQELRKAEVQKIVRDEIDSFISKELEKEVTKLLKKSNSAPRQEVVDVAKIAIEKLAEFLWVRRSVWKGDIR